MRRLMTAVAAIALVAGAAHAQGNGRGGGHGGGGGPQAGEQGGKGERGGGGGGDREDRGNRGGGGQAGGMAAGAPMEGGGSKDRGNASRGNEARGDRGNGNARTAGNDNRRDNRGPAAQRADSGDRGRGNDRDVVRLDRGRGNDRDVVLVDDRRYRGDVVRVVDFASIPHRGLIAGCPPGLAKKHNGCRPPGHARHWHYDRPDFWGLRLADGRYWYDDGYLVRLDRDGRIGSYIPLLGGALAIGNPWPTFYEPVALPTYYVDYYDLGPYDAYRYADNVIYRVDPETAAITSVAALLTGDDFVVGRPMPLGYDVYNVPYAYRSRYADGPDAMYRYADGHIYQLDPETRLIAAAIEILAT